jgi:uncharacterized membrane protein
MIVGWFGAAVAVLSGLIDALRQFSGPEAVRDPAVLMWVNAHAAAGLAALFIFGRALLIRRRNPAILSDRQRRRGYLGLLSVGAALIVLSGWLGGRLVYQYKIGV